jgi:leucyl aminopeptidase
MKITISTLAPSQIETECLVVTVVDAAAESKNESKPGDKPKPAPQLLTGDKAVNAAAADLIASGEVTGKMLEVALLHKPNGLKAKRLLLIGGGKAKTFSSYELRKLAGAALRNLKARNLKSFVMVAPNLATGVSDAVKSIVEGAYVGSFEPNYYQSDRRSYGCRPGRRESTERRRRSRTHHRRGAELRARPGERAEQQDDPDHHGRARQKDV